MSAASRTPPARARRRWIAAGLVLAAWAVVYLPGLGAAGFTNTEGHRSIPAFELIAKDHPAIGDWITPTLFDRVYLRKPPGMTWLVAATSSVFGSTEWSARLVSALSVLVAAGVSGVCARRWFGLRAGLPGALAVVLMPAMWYYGRTAELEAPMFAGALVASLCALDLMVSSRLHAQHRAQRWIAAMGLCAGLVCTLAIKGPAGLPAVLGVLLAGVIATRSIRTIASMPMLAAIGIAAVCAAGWWIAAARLTSDASAVVTQSPGAFLWAPDRLGSIALLAPMALFAGLPMTLVMVFPWGRDASSEPLGQDQQAWLISRTLAFATLLTAGVLVISGVSNPRYALPVLVFVGPMVGWAVAGVGRMTPVRARIARVMLLGGPRVAGVVFVCAGLVYAVAIEPRWRPESGREAGQAMTTLVPKGSLVYADHAVEARPEVLLELVRRGSHVRWSPLPDGRYPEEAYLVVRHDERSDELSAHKAGRPNLGSWSVHEYEMVLLGPVTER